MAGTLYSHMEFPVYEYREYPKVLNNDKPEGALHGKGYIVNNKDEEDKYLASMKAKPKSKEED